MKIKCKCGNFATWCYMPNDAVGYCCDDCVPRGCSCNEHLKDELEFETQEEYDELCKNHDNFIEELDEQGRPLPCCEWWYNEEGWDNED